MASSFGKKTSRNIGTALTGIGSSATPASGKAWTVFGVSLCNRSSQAISVDLLLRETGPLDTYIVSAFTIPAGDTHFTIGALSKQVMLPTDIMMAKSSVAASLDVILNYVEVDQA